MTAFLFYGKKNGKTPTAFFVLIHATKKILLMPQNVNFRILSLCEGRPENLIILFVAGVSKKWLKFSKLHETLVSKLEPH